VSRKRARNGRTGVLVALALLVAAPSAVAADCPRTSLADVEDEVMCPVCGTPLELATEAPQAQRERLYIQRLVDDCRSKDEIKRALVGQFGDSVLALPGDSEGERNLGDVLVYAIPALALLLGAGGIVLAARRWRGRPRRSGEPLAPRADSPRLREDMERYDL
jgi:cytochrome c-type biogenesis protein CcmH